MNSQNEPATDRAAQQAAQEYLFDGDFSLVPEDSGYRGPVACSVAGITYRQLDYWARTGLVTPPRSRARRDPVRTGCTPSVTWSS